MEIKLDDANVKKLIGEALLQALTPEAKDALIAKALETLVSPAKDQYSGKMKAQSPLEIAFERAIANEAETFARKMVEESVELRAKLGTLIEEACNQVFEKRRDEVVTKIAEGIGTSLFNLR